MDGSFIEMFEPDMDNKTIPAGVLAFVLLDQYRGGILLFHPDDSLHGRLR
jgi:hypothetical protein